MSNIDRDKTYAAQSDQKIVAGLERLSQVFRTLLWEKAKTYQLSPIQIQILLFVHQHPSEFSSISALALEFQVTKPTISDAVRMLEQKKMISKRADSHDNRKYSIVLLPAGEEIAKASTDYTHPIASWAEKLSACDQEQLWGSISGLIRVLNKEGVITVQRTCYACHYYSVRENSDFCNLLQKKLKTNDIQIDCTEFKRGSAV